jgi:carbon storage regulator
MLVIKRKVGEEVSIGDSVVLRVLEVKGAHVRVGIDAPKDIRVLRGEQRKEPAA